MSCFFPGFFIRGISNRHSNTNKGMLFISNCDLVNYCIDLVQIDMGGCLFFGLIPIQDQFFFIFASSDYFRVLNIMAVNTDFPVNRLVDCPTLTRKAGKGRVGGRNFIRRVIKTDKQIYFTSFTKVISKDIIIKIKKIIYVFLDSDIISDMITFNFSKLTLER